MQSLRKIVPFCDLTQWRNKLLPEDRPLVVTNGCFDLLHPGHIFLLESARALGSRLLIGVTGDQSVRLLKGAGRPIIPEADRVLMLCSLEAVSAVCLFAELDAVQFLSASRPDIYAKGGDYTLETINQDERRLLEKMGTKIKIIPQFESRSTSSLLRRIMGPP